MKSVDLDPLIPQLDPMSSWRVYKRQRTRLGKLCCPSTTIYKGNKKLCRYLTDMGYKDKIGKDAINIIPIKLVPFWIRGLFDGDGSFYHNLKHYTYQITIAGHDKMDWSFIPDCLNFKQNHKTSSGSSIRITNRSGCVAFMSYIYPNGYDGLGLHRKYELATDALYYT